MTDQLKDSIIDFSYDGSSVISITAKGFHYRGRFVEDAGEAHRLLVDFLREHAPYRDWMHAAPVEPTKAELRQIFDDQSGYINDQQVMWWSDFQAAARAILARWAPSPISGKD